MRRRRLAAPAVAAPQAETPAAVVEAAAVVEPAAMVEPAASIAETTPLEPEAAPAAAVFVPAAPAATATADAQLADIDDVLAAPATEVVSGAEAVTEALARLADLRDSGAITEADFEAKKQDLLDRL